MNDILSSMGIKDAFDKDKANFKSMSDVKTYISKIKQGAYIKVDEEGTVAASVSSGKMLATAVAHEPVVFHADHPFVYLIVERSSQAILFAGKYMGN